MAFMVSNWCNLQSSSLADHILGYVFAGSYDEAKHILGYILPEHTKNHKFVNYFITKYMKFNKQQKLPLKFVKLLDNEQDNFDTVSIKPSLI